MWLNMNDIACCIPPWPGFINKTLYYAQTIFHPVLLFIFQSFCHPVLLFHTVPLLGTKEYLTNTNDMYVFQSDLTEITKSEKIGCSMFLY